MRSETAKTRMNIQIIFNDQNQMTNAITTYLASFGVFCGVGVPWVVLPALNWIDAVLRLLLDQKL